MTTAALTVGCAFLAFSPTLTLLFLLTYSKANLIIIVTTSAFAYLLSTVLSSLFWLPVPSSLRSNPYVLIFPAIVCQFVCRAGFVWLYHRVEHSVERSVRHHERAERAQTTASSRGRGASSSADASDENDDDDDDGDNDEGMADSAKLRLELNDWSSALAAGTGFGGMHSIFLYGTLLASESGNLGTLYQPSCHVMPSLVNSAIMANVFSVLDVFWMLFCFYGMRRRRDAGAFESEGGLVNAPPRRAGSAVSFSQDVTGGGSGGGPSRPTAPYQLSNNKSGGNMALILVLLSHCAASLATVPNAYDNGCVVALPCLAGVLVLTGLAFWVACSGHYLPTAQRRRLWERTASMAAEANGAAVAAAVRSGRYED